MPLGYSQCGGCSFRHITYEAELEAKRRRVEDAVRRIGGFQELAVPPVGSEKTERYRNKAQLPIGTAPGGRDRGLYALHSHRIIPLDDCALQPESFTAAIKSQRTG